MSKLDENGKPVKRADGKILKSKLFSPPNLSIILSSPPEPASKDQENDAVGFAEWMGDEINPFVRLENGRWVQACGNSTSWSTEQLYSLYKEQL